MIFEAAHQMALLPVLWLGGLLLRRQPRTSGWWWIALGFGVSWLADTVAHIADPWAVSVSYPVLQAACFALGLLKCDRDRLRFVGGLLAIWALALALRGLRGPDLLVHTAAWGGIAGIAWGKPASRLRDALLIGYGVGLLAWLGYSCAPGWATWLLFQSVRAVALGAFCFAVERNDGVPA